MQQVIVNLFYYILYFYILSIHMTILINYILYSIKFIDYMDRILYFSSIILDNITPFCLYCLDKIHLQSNPSSTKGINSEHTYRLFGSYGNDGLRDLLPKDPIPAVPTAHA